MVRMRLIPLLVTASIVLVAVPSFAQVPPDSLVGGDTVQYELSGPVDDLPEEGRGTFEALTPSMVLLSSVDDFNGPIPVELPRGLIEDFRVARGTENVRWLLTGIGFAAGLAITVPTLFDDRQDDSALLALPLLTIGGFVLGSAIKGPRWEDVELDSRV